MDKIITAIFKVESEGYQALTELKQNPETDKYVVSQAVLIKKENNGLNTLDSFDTGIETSNDTLAGGLIGGLVGILGGPIGMLLGGSLGALTGSVFDLGDALDNESIIEKVSDMIMDGEVCMIALAQEKEPGQLQQKLAKFNVSIVESDAAEVEEEIEQAIKAEKELEKEARAKLREAQKEDLKNKVEEKKQQLQAGIEEVKAKVNKD